MSITTHDGWLSARDFGATGCGDTISCRFDGTNKIIVEDPSGFAVGQWITVLGCTTTYERPWILYGPYDQVGNYVKYTDQFEYRGYTGLDGEDWTVYFIDVPAGRSDFFHWTDDMGVHWHRNVPRKNGEWYELSGGCQVKFNDYAWEGGASFGISARNSLNTVIEAIDGNVLTLRDSTTRVGEGRVVHDDTRALNAAAQAAKAQKKNLFIPSGHYRISSHISIAGVKDITVEGSSAASTLLDISEGVGMCMQLWCCENVTVRNLSMKGGMGFDERKKAGFIPMQGSSEFWGFIYKQSFAMGIYHSQKILVENVHASRMSAECFVSNYDDQYIRIHPEEPSDGRQPSTVFVRCSVTDCARNAFNNTNSELYYCRIENVGGCTVEEPSRYVKMIGCYVKNAGGVAVSNIRDRKNEHERYPRGQLIVEDCVFESGEVLNHAGGQINLSAGGSQFIIRGNQFINYNENAIFINPGQADCEFPVENNIIVGNSIDMTCEGEEPKKRIGIMVGASDTTVSDNQISVRGKDVTVTAIAIADYALRVNVHDNITRGVGHGIKSFHIDGKVGDTVGDDGRCFKRKYDAWGGMPYLLRRRSHRYRDWHIVWMDEKGGENIIAELDPVSLVFTLKNTDELYTGRPFRIYPPAEAGWLIHDNILQAEVPMELDTYSGRTAHLEDNIEIYETREV